ncbi:MAG: hypothetical protein KIH62_002635, partial [Candidatus Kerfeldbacteria bacterium]|nr:hypothetical protein [Candidatus Kerfeldbacteria bacterium]
SNRYYVGARLETSTHQSLSQDIDTASVGGANYKSLTSYDVFNGSSATLNCTDPVYCLYGDATT